MLSARLLKINELRNALTELQQRTDELQKENRILRQVGLSDFRPVKKNKNFMFFSQTIFNNKIPFLLHRPQHNRLQLQVRQEKALSYDDTESEISQLLSRHSNEIHVLRERLRRSQERERTAERQLKDTEERLQRSQSTVSRLKKLVDQQDLGAREELSRRLEEEKSRAQEAERKLKVKSVGKKNSSTTLT